MKAFFLIAFLGLVACDPPNNETNPIVLQEDCSLDGTIKYADNASLKVRTCRLHNDTVCVMASNFESETPFVNCFKVENKE